MNILMLKLKTISTKIEIEDKIAILYFYENMFYLFILT